MTNAFSRRLLSATAAIGMSLTAVPLAAPTAQDAAANIASDHTTFLETFMKHPPSPCVASFNIEGGREQVEGDRPVFQGSRIET